MDQEKMKSVNGFCFFHLENGCRHWAFQANNFIVKDAEPTPFCKKCGKNLDSRKVEDLSVKAIKNLLLIQGLLDDKVFVKCPEGQHERGVLDSWSFDGSYALKDGDHLTIYSKDKSGEVVWSGVFNSQQLPPEKFFVDEYPATLIVAYLLLCSLE